MLKGNRNKLIFAGSFILFLLISYSADFNSGKAIAANFSQFAVQLLKIFPCVFILIGLFEVWMKKETVEKYLGRDSGWLCYLWMILLAGTIVGGLYVAFPVAYSLQQKGAKLSAVFTFIGAAAICRIPLTMFEASFIGMKFTLIRLLVSIPLVILSSIWLGRYLERTNYSLREPDIHEDN